MPPQLETNHVVPTSWQDEALARDGVSREVPCSALKGETVPEEPTLSPTNVTSRWAFRNVAWLPFVNDFASFLQRRQRVSRSKDEKEKCLHQQCYCILGNKYFTKSYGRWGRETREEQPNVD